MSRPLRLEFPGALYHVTARGDHQQAIYRDDTDRSMWQEVLGNVCARFHFTVHAFCQMSNHYHLLIETEEANLSRGMRQLNCVYSQYFNRRHQLVGHVFQGRYKAILVQKERHLLELSRYIVLNPVRAGMVRSPLDWPWSSFILTIQQERPPVWLQPDWLLATFAPTREVAVQAYLRFVSAGIGQCSPMKNVRHQLLLGDDIFVQQHKHRVNRLEEVTREHRRALVLPLEEYQRKFTDRDTAMLQAYLSTAYTMVQIAAHFGVSYRTVSRLIHRAEQRLKQSSCAIGRTDPG